MENNKPHVKFFRSLKTQLIITFLIVSVLPLLIVGWLTFNQSQVALRQQVEYQLQDVRNLKADQLKAFFKTVSEDIVLQAESPVIIQAIQDLALTPDELYQVRRGYLPNPNLNVSGLENYDTRHADHHPFFENIVKTKGYGDIYLINPNGDIIYNFDKGNDFATNLQTGIYKDTHLADLYQELSTDPTPDRFKFSDFVRYRPSNNEPAGFVGTPIFDEEEYIGVLIFQLPLARLNDLMQSQADVIGKNGEVYLVGEDKLMRSDSRFEEDAILNQEVDTLAVQKALQDGDDIESVTSYRGVPVLSAYQPLQFGDRTWALVAEVSEDEALALPNQLRNVVLSILGISALVVAGLGLLIAQRITQPITNLTEVAVAITEGDLSRTAREKSGNEIGLLAQAFNRLTYQQQALINELDDKVRERTAQLEAQVERLRAVNQVGRELTKDIRLSSQEILELIYKQTSRLMDTTNMYIAWYDADKQLLRFPLSYYEGEWDDVVVGTERPVDLDNPNKGGLTEIVIKSEQTLLVNDVAHYLDENKMTLPHPPDPKSWLGIPIVLEGKLIGVVVLYSYEATGRYSQDDQEVLEAMVGQAAVAIENARLYNELEKATVNIAEREAALTRSIIATDFVHNIRNLVGTIPLWIDLINLELEAETVDKTVITEHLSQIDEETQRLLTGASELEKTQQIQRIDVQKMIEAILNRLEIQYDPEIKNGNLEFKNRLGNDLWVSAIALSLDNALMNVVENGVEAILEAGQGTLTIKATNIMQTNQDWVKIEVNDTGVGIPSENLGQLFNLSFTTKKGNGRGYGLWRSKGYIEASLRGTITVNSQYSNGTTFTILLPKATENANV